MKRTCLSNKQFRSIDHKSSIMNSEIHLMVTVFFWLTSDVVNHASASTEYFYIPGNGSNCLPTHIPVDAVIVQNSNFTDTSLVSDCQMTFEVDDIKPHDLYFDYNSFMAHTSTGDMHNCETAILEIFTTMLQDHGAYQSFSWSDKPQTIIDCPVNATRRETKIISGPYIRLNFRAETFEVQDFNFEIVITKVKQEKFCRWKDYICPEGQCIDSSNRCDGIRHCLNGDDERSCGNFFVKWWYVVVNYFTKGSFNTFRIVMILVIILAILLGLYNQRGHMQRCLHKIMGRAEAGFNEGSQTPLQQVSSQSPPPYAGHSGSYLDHNQENGYPTEQPSGYSGYLPVSQKDCPQSAPPSRYTYNTESAYTVKF